MGEREENEKATAEVAFSAILRRGEIFIVAIINCGCGEETVATRAMPSVGHRTDKWIVKCDGCPARYNLVSVIIESM